jgi:hypothetical protein
VSKIPKEKLLTLLPWNPGVFWLASSIMELKCGASLSVNFIVRAKSQQQNLFLICIGVVHELKNYTIAIVDRTRPSPRQISFEFMSTQAGMKWLFSKLLQSLFYLRAQLGILTD